MIAQLGIERVDLIGQIHALALELRSQIGREHGGDDGVLVAGVGALEVAAALLEAEDEAILLALLLQRKDLAADVLEARQNTAHFHAVFRRDLVGHRR